MLEKTETRRRFLIERSDQISLFLIICFSFAALLFYYFGQSGDSAGMIDIETVEPVHVAFIVDINLATWPELSQLPGVGESLAKRIVKHREKHGLFANHEELIKISGIGQTKLQTMKPYLATIDRIEALSVVQ